MTCLLKISVTSIHGCYHNYDILLQIRLQQEANRKIAELAERAHSEAVK